MSVHTFTAALKSHSVAKSTNQPAQDALSCGLDVEQVSSTNVVNIRSARKAQDAARQELMDYLMWTMKHDMDPHRLYDDPIEVLNKT
jgi:hypothetical protein